MDKVTRSALICELNINFIKKNINLLLGKLRKQGTKLTKTNKAFYFYCSRDTGNYNLSLKFYFFTYLIILCLSSKFYFVYILISIREGGEIKILKKRREKIFSQAHFSKKKILILMLIDSFKKK
jgi:hypothetical protein